MIGYVVNADQAQELGPRVKGLEMSMPYSAMYVTSFE